MNNKLLATVGAAAFSICLSAGVSHAASLEPGETMGIAALAPLPEGVFFLDNENYGKQDNSNTRLGVNIPLIVWSTPWTIYNTRLEFLAALPFAHLDGGGVNQIGAISYAFGTILAHDFGGGFTGGLATIVRTPDPSVNIQRLSGRTQVQADIRGGLYYTTNGFNFAETSWYTGTFGNHATFAYNDAVGVDFSATKTFDKLEVGMVGLATTDIQNTPGAGGRFAEVALGGMVGYNFGTFTLQGMVTRDVLRTVNGSSAGVGKETRGWLRLIVPLYVAAAPVVAAPLKARY